VVTAKRIQEYQEEQKGSLKEAKTILYRNAFCNELRTDTTVSDMADTLIRILEFEFGDGYEG